MIQDMGCTGVGRCGTSSLRRWFRGLDCGFYALIRQEWLQLKSVWKVTFAV